MNTLTLSNDSIIVDEQIRSEAIELVESAEDARLDRMVVIIDGSQHEIPASLSRLLVHVIERAARGGIMTIRSMPDELTTTVAADLLGVSRPTLMKMIKEGELRSREVGTHRRIRSRDALELRDKRDASRKAAIARLRESSPN